MPEQKRPPVLHIIVACAVVAGTWLWLASATGLGTEIPWVLLVDAFLIVPAGALIVQFLMPEGCPLAARLALTGSAGYVATTVVAVALGSLGALFLYPFVCGAICALWAARLWRQQKRGARLRSFASVREFWQHPSALTVLVIVCLSLVVITPIMTPVETLSPNRFVSFAYIDAYQSLSSVQNLVRHVPAAEDFSFAGMPALVYPDFHYTYLAMLKRLSGATSTDIYFCHGAMLLVLLSVPLGYAIGRELTGQRLGGYVAATLLYLGVMPNPYDLNPTLANVSTPYMPTFYQTHFFSPRFNQHEGAGGILILSAVLTLALYDRMRGSRSKVGTLVLGACFIAALARFRSQHLLAAAPAFLLVCTGLWIAKRDRRYLAGPAVFAIGLALLVVEMFAGRYDATSTRFVIQYGAFGWDLLNKWYLPARMQLSVIHLPAIIAPAAAVTLWVAFRLVGLNLGVLILGRGWQILRQRKPPTSAELFCAITLIGAVIASLSIQRPRVLIGHQILQMTHLLAVLLAILPLTAVARALVAASRPELVRRGIGPIVLIALTLVAHRAADAAMHDQLPRGYTFSSAEHGAYRWIHEHTHADAVVAAHPDHRVNPAGETIASTEYLSAMTERRVFFQRASVSSRRTGRRAGQLRGLFAADSPESACAAAADLPLVNYLMEYADTPLSVRDAPCLREVFAQEGIRVLRVDTSPAPQ